MKYSHRLRVVALVFLVAFFLKVNAQAPTWIFNRFDSAKRPENAESNVIKINLPALVFKNFSFQYEKQLGKKQSFAVAIRFRPSGIIPFQSTIEDIVDDTSIRVDLMKISNFAITPEYRFYLGKKGAVTGFYIAPFVSYNHYTADIPVNYDYYDDVNHTSYEKIALFRGSTNTFTAGFQIGAQWKLSDKFYLDWWIIGPNYGICNGDYTFNGALTDTEVLSLEIRLKELVKPSLPLDIMKDININANGGAFKTKGPWAGFRALGVNLGYRF